MTSRFGLPCLSTRPGVTGRSLGLLFLCLSLLLLVAPPVASQGGDAGGGTALSRRPWKPNRANG